MVKYSIRLLVCFVKDSISTCTWHIANHDIKEANMYMWCMYPGYSMVVRFTHTVGYVPAKSVIIPFALLLELQDFLILVTGTTIAKDRSIIVHFDDDTHGSIAAHTCSNEIHFPLGVFKEYEVFKMAMDAVVCAPGKKKYNII